MEQIRIFLQGKYKANLQGKIIFLNCKKQKI